MKTTRFAVMSTLLFGVTSIVACGGSEKPPAAPEAAPVAEPAPAPVEDPSDVHIKGDHLVIDKKIHFGNDSDEIMGDSTEIIDHIAQALKNHTELSVVHVIGHTDSKGDDAHNLELSEKRAAAVVAALTERGVTQQMDARGAGEKEPACTEDTDECHEKNRRVEFVVAKAEE